MEKARGQETVAASALMDDQREELARLAGAVAAHLRRNRRLGRALLPGGLPPSPKPDSLQRKTDTRQARRADTAVDVSQQRRDGKEKHRPSRGGPIPSGRQPPTHGVTKTNSPRPETTQDKTKDDPGDSCDVTAELAANDIPGAVGLARVKALLGNCHRCPLASRRHHIVFGQGDPSAEVMFIGEAPGAEEDRQGLPFVGAAGTLLTKMLKAMGLRRQNVYVANILKCRPPNNRDPLPEEIAVCLPFLEAQIRAIQPRIIVTLGRVAAQTLLDTQASLSSLRGTFHDYKGITVMPTYHPAYLLRRPEGKRAAWHDLQLVMREMDRLGMERDRSLR